MTTDEPVPPAAGIPPLRPTRAAGTRVVGVLGGIASGKSLVAAELAGADGLWIDADALAHEVLESPEVAERIAARFGAECIDPAGRPRRPALARIVFADEAARRELESWIHPRVRATIRDRIDAARAAGTPLVALDVPLLLDAPSDASLDGDRQALAAQAHESQTLEARTLKAECDLLVFVDSDLEQRAAWAAAGRGWDSDEVQRREAAQTSNAAKRAAADVVIDNRSTVEELIQRVRDLRAELLSDR